MDVLLVHAFPFDQRFWAAQVALAPPDVRFHTLDLPGFGSAAAQPAKSIDDFAVAIQAASHGLQRFVLCGLSMGGYSMFAWWRRYAGDPRVAGLVFADTKAEADTPVGKTGRDGTIALVRSRGPTAVADQLLPRLLSPKASAETVALARAVMVSQTVEAIVGASEAMRDRSDSKDLLATIDVPVLGIAGAEDALTPPQFMETIVRGVARGRLAVLPDAGHLANLEQPEAFTNSVVTFARSVS
jgi:pimeloyl-ACP methyl ester carboxylesterase